MDAFIHLFQSLFFLCLIERVPQISPSLSRCILVHILIWGHKWFQVFLLQFLQSRVILYLWVWKRKDILSSAVKCDDSSVVIFGFVLHLYAESVVDYILHEDVAGILENFHFGLLPCDAGCCMAEILKSINMFRVEYGLDCFLEELLQLLIGYAIQIG